MMKKMKGVVAAASMERTPVFSGYDDPRARFRHQSLMQDYEELLKETEAQKNKLQMMKQKKLTLLSEVRFLRRRQEFLMANQPLAQTVNQNSVKPQHSQIQSKKIPKERNRSRKVAALSHPALGFDLNRRGKTYNNKQATLQNAIPVFDLNQKLKTYRGKESTFQKSMPVLDLNQKEKVYNRKEAAVHNMTPVFDLNQISREEEELEFNSEPWRVEESKKSSIRGGGDEQHNDVKLSVCRNIGNGANRAGKRKISWQDQVALRV
ncbi:Ribosomal RNA small subunit methyltransferase G [Melia azedarach]|uniref:Ribosomal RNA small subunit methyltransferase G n=1 Tax=Melia azedarach TaxID=155640 RepID=A0ACC1XGT0_MELAZ|nr:Ribosomal RNA small subunit methyltransferase G [Melia azedarach]